MATGKIRIGSVLDQRPHLIDEAILSKHFLAVGQSGAGKTTLFYNLISQLEVPFWCFDLKQDYRHLITQDEDLLVLPWSELKFNPLVAPPGVPLRRWAQVVSEIFGHATALLSGSKNYLLKSILELYRLYGLFQERSPPYPSLHELEQWMASEPINYVRKTANYRDTVLNRVEAMNLGAGTIFDCSQGYDLEELLEQDVVFEFDGLSRDTQNFLMELLLAAVYEYRLAQTHRSTGLNHVFVLDEAKQVFSIYKERQDAAGIPAIDELTAKLREFGEGLLVGDQEASKLTDSIKANTFTKTLLPTGDRKQFTAVADSMNLTEYQIQAAQNLEIGQAVIQTGNDDPVKVRLDTYELEKEVTDTHLERQQGAAWASLSSEPRERPPRYTQAINPASPHDPEEPDIIDEPPSKIQLTGDAEKLLKHVIENPFQPLTKRYEQFPSRYKGDKAKTELIETGLVVERSLSLSTGARTLLELTDRGRAYVESDLDLDPEGEGRGGIIHRYWQHQVKGAFEAAGWATKLEMFDADVYVNTGQFELVIEIALGNNQREVEHIEKHVDRGFEVIWVVCPSEEVLNGIQRRLEDTSIEPDRITLQLTQDVSDAVESLQ